MDREHESVLVVGFNTRPLIYSLNKAGYQVYSIDFFGDLDLYPYVKDSIIIIKKLGTSYDSIKDDYHKYLAQFTIDLLQKNPDIQNLIIASGLDDAIEERKYIINEINSYDYKINDLNNEIDVIREARNIEKIYRNMQELNYRFPITYSFNDIENTNKEFSYPIIFKKKKSSGGINVNKIETKDALDSLINKLDLNGFNPSEWLIQEYIKGIPVSCTTISNGIESEVISINRQIIGLKNLNPPKEFMYCGNIVPGNLLNEENRLISEISITLANKLRLKGINGFDFILRNHYPYLMEINPRIPGSIRASECSYNLNLLDLHIQSFYLNKWKWISEVLNNSESIGYTTKLIFFSPKEIQKEKIHLINKIEYIHDKTEPIRNIAKGEPICTILYHAKLFSDSYFGALKIADEISKIIA